MKVFRLSCLGLGSILLLLIVVPVVKMIAAADPNVLQEAAADKEVIQAMMLTFRAALWATMGAAILGIPLALALARWQFPAKGLIQGIIDLPVMIPHTAAGIALLMVFGRRFFLGKVFSNMGLPLVGTEAGISLAMAFVSLPFLVNAARDGFASIDPRLERVARTLGASPWRVFFRISLPLARPSIVTGLIMMWARGISEFGAVVILAYHPMTASVLIWERFESYGLTYARPVAVLLVLVCLALFSLLRGFAWKTKEP